MCVRGRDPPHRQEILRPDALKYFIIESHGWLPGILVFLPRRMLVRLLRFTHTFWFWPTRAIPNWRLLTIGEFSKMFPDATIEREWSFGFVKSLMAIKA